MMFSKKRTLLAIGALFVALTTLFSPVNAETHGTRTVIRLFDATVTLPMPNWQLDNDIAGSSEISRRENKSSFLLEFIPKGDSFTNWSRLYAVRADRAPSLSIAEAYDNQVGIYSNVCGGTNLKLQKLESDRSHILFVLICADSPRGPAKLGYGPGIGEIAVFWIGKRENTVIKIFHHWRGNSFDPGDQATWPASKSKVQEVIEKFGSILVR